MKYLIVVLLVWLAVAGYVPTWISALAMTWLVSCCLTGNLALIKFYAQPGGQAGQRGSYER